VPFGKNKIQYREFDWQILAGPNVDVYYYPEEEDVARLALQYAEESYAVLEKKFQHHPFRRIPLIVYSSDQHFEQTNVFPGFIPEGVLGFTEYLKRRVALPFRGDYNQFRNTLRHELVHAFQISKISDVTSQHPRIRRPSARCRDAGDDRRGWRAGVSVALRRAKQSRAATSPNRARRSTRR
jgi:hypothetical protein